jgi:regulator of protease activity HflC (stomatin/prohibitin superfamily)
MMGLVSSLLNIGIRVEAAAVQVGTRLGKVPLQWPAGEAGSIIYRLPRDPHLRASVFSTTQPIIVNEGELALVLEDGKAQGALEPGSYLFERQRVVGSLDVIWLKTGQRALKWGVGNVSSADGIQISGNGVAYLKVADPIAFNAEVIQGSTTMPDVDLQRFVMPRIQGVLRPVIGRWQALELQTQREIFTGAVRNALSETLMKMGVGIVDFEVVEINFPPEFKEVIAQATMVRHVGAASVIQAQANAQVTQIAAAAQAQAQLMAGQAQAQMMAAIQAVGIDPLKLKALEALEVFAATPSPSGMLTAGDPAKAQLFGQVAAAALAGSTINPAVDVDPAGQGAMREPSTSAMIPTLQLSAGAEQLESSRETVEDVNRQIDGLTGRLSEGKVSEETYNKLVARLEAKLQKLGGG